MGNSPARNLGGYRGLVRAAVWLLLLVIAIWILVAMENPTLLWVPMSLAVVCEVATWWWADRDQS